MPRTHGDLFGEIGRMVFDAHQGAAIDLSAASQDLANRYSDLRLPAEAIAKAIARSAGAIGVSMALLEATIEERDLASQEPPPPPGGSGFAGLPSGGRIAMLS